MEFLQQHRLTPERVWAYLFGGNANLVLRSQTSGKHWRFRISEHRKRKEVWYVYDEIMSSRTGKFCFVGSIFATYPKSGQYLFKPQDFSTREYQDGDEWSEEDVRDLVRSAQVFNWTFVELRDRPANPMLNKLEMYHTGTCSACRRRLTDPESLAAGLGPECRKKLGL